MIPSSCSVSGTSSIAKFISDHPCLTMLETQCSNMSDLQIVHARLIKTGLVNDTIAASRVLAFAASPRTGNIHYAHALFTRLRNPNPFSWNTIIRAFSNSSTPDRAISLFLDMLVASDVEPQRLTYPSLFKAYALLRRPRGGSELHGRVAKLGLDRDEFVRNSMIRMYASSGMLGEARQLFDEIPEPDSVAWNSMITGLSSFGRLDESRRMFDAAPARTPVTWNAMIGGYVRNGKFAEALELFSEMHEEEIELSEFTMASLLTACGRLGAAAQGEWLHGRAARTGRLDGNAILVTAVVDMYGKCGSPEKALRVFQATPNPPLSCWNSTVMALATNGREEEAIELFSRLTEPDDVSFLAALTACRHAGMVERALGLLSSMTEKYGIEPSIRHYSCVVDVLGQAGLIEEAMSVISAMPVGADAAVWGSVLSACERHGEVEMGRRAADRLAAVEPGESSGYVLMSRVYAGSGRFDKAVRRRVEMREKRVEKEPGCSSIEVDGHVHEFVAFGRAHPRTGEIYALLQ